MKKIIALFLAAAMLLPVVALANASDVLIMGSNFSFPPFEYVDDQGNFAGFDLEIAKLVGKELVPEDMAFDGLLLALDGGKIDIAIAGMTITPERLEQVNFSDSYFNAQQAVIVRKDYDGIKTVEDLQGKTIAVQEGTTGHLMVTEDFGIPTENVPAFKNAADAVMELAQGRADCMIIDTAPAGVFVAKNPDLMILEGIDMPVEDYGIAVKKGNDELLAACNEVLAEIKASGKYDELVAQFFQ